MRTIKFRAWGKNGKMYDRVLAGPGDPCSIVWDDERKDWVHFDEVSGVIMQFTGLHDKNGVEMWEHDIVKITAEIPKATVNDGRIGVIVYNDDTPEFIVKGNFLFQHISKFDGVEFEVLGNTHANPELLSKASE